METLKEAFYEMAAGKLTTLVVGVVSSMHLHKNLEMRLNFHIFVS